MTITALIRAHGALFWVIFAFHRGRRAPLALGRGAGGCGDFLSVPRAQPGAAAASVAAEHGGPRKGQCPGAIRAALFETDAQKAERSTGPPQLARTARCKWRLCTPGESKALF